MLNNRKILCVIPARGGSKGIPDKNIYPICGKPLIVYSIECALACSVIDEIYVSTDSRKIADVAEKSGVKVPELRPAGLSGDKVKSIDVVKDIISKYPPGVFDILLLLQPTAPLRIANDVMKCLEIACSDELCTSVVSVCRIEDHHPMKMKKIRDGYLAPFIDGTESEVPRQELPPAFRLNGAIYATKVSVILKDNNFFGDRSIPYIMPEEKSVSIDCVTDIVLSEYFMRKRTSPPHTVVTDALCMRQDF